MGIAVMCMPEGEEGSVCIGSAAKEEKERRKRGYTYCKWQIQYVYSS